MTSRSHALRGNVLPDAPRCRTRTEVCPSSGRRASRRHSHAERGNEDSQLLVSVAIDANSRYWVYGDPRQAAENLLTDRRGDRTERHHWARTNTSSKGCLRSESRPGRIQRLHGGYDFHGVCVDGEDQRPIRAPGHVLTGVPTQFVCRGNALRFVDRICPGSWPFSALAVDDDPRQLLYRSARLAVTSLLEFAPLHALSTIFPKTSFDSSLREAVAHVLERENGIDDRANQAASSQGTTWPANRWVAAIFSSSGRGSVVPTIVQALAQHQVQIQRGLAAAEQADQHQMASGREYARGCAPRQWLRGGRSRRGLPCPLRRLERHSQNLHAMCRCRDPGPMPWCGRASRPSAMSPRPRSPSRGRAVPRLCRHRCRRRESRLARRAIGEPASRAHRAR